MKTPLDYIRLFDVAEAGIVILFVVALIFCYLVSLKSNGKQHHRLLVMHIVLIGTSYIVLMIAFAIDTMDRLGLAGYTWRLPVLTFAVTLSNVALWMMIWRLYLIGYRQRYERRKHGFYP